MATKNSGLVGYAGSTGIIEERNPAIPSVVCLARLRTVKDEFEGAGVVGALVKLSDGGYLVQVTKQYHSGGKHYLAHKLNFSNVAEGYKALRSMMRNSFRTVVSRKFSVILGEVINED